MSTFSVAKGMTSEWFSMPEEQAERSPVCAVVQSGWLPDSMARTVDVGYHGADNDYGENVLQLLAARDLCLLVDMTHQYPGRLDYSRTACFGTSLIDRQWIATVTSTVVSIPGQAVCWGPRANVFHWEYVDLNQPGILDYRPEVPWISKRRWDKRIAADIHSYVDDNRETAFTAEMAWLASSQVAKDTSV
jgi:hypothetical protein